MDSNKIAFIICVNDELYFSECCWYINRLSIPKTMSIDIISIREANSMTEAYNAAMISSDAKFKIYIHQDTFIYNQNFIHDMLDIFYMDEKIGIMGMYGGINLPQNGVVYSAWNSGKLITGNWIKTKCYTSNQKKPFMCVEAVDGLLLATQYDINWRYDILKQWDFYDIAQCLEYRKLGYKVVIPYQETAWVHHDCGYNKFKNYNKNREIMLDAYPEFFSEVYREEDAPYYNELDELADKLYKDIELCINSGGYDDATEILAKYDYYGGNKNLLLLKLISHITNLEREKNIIHFLNESITVELLVERYTIIKFFLRRIEVNSGITERDIYDWIVENNVSYIEIVMSTTHNIVDGGYVLKQIAKAYRIGNEIKKADIIDSCIKEYYK